MSQLFKLKRALSGLGGRMGIRVVDQYGPVTGRLQGKMLVLWAWWSKSAVVRIKTG